MLKGHVQIDLHNHKTGLIERIEQDNLITNAVEKLVNLSMGRNRTAETFLPLSTKALGGVMLFEDQLTESASNTMFPYSNRLIGYAGRTANISSRQMGSLNAIETGPVENGYANVWEFSSSQANGTISSMALTNSVIGSGSILYPVYDYTIFANNTNTSIIKMENNYIYYILNKVVYRRRVPLDNFQVNDSSNYIDAAEQVGTITPHNSGDTFDDRYWRSGNDGYIYYSRISTASGNRSCTIERFDATTYEYQDSMGIRFTIAGEHPSDPTVITFDLASGNGFFNEIAVSDGKIYVLTKMTGGTAQTLYPNALFLGIYDYIATTGTVVPDTIKMVESTEFSLGSDSNSGATLRRIYASDDGSLMFMSGAKQSISGNNRVKYGQICIGQEDTKITVFDGNFANTDIRLPYLNYDGITQCHNFTANNPAVFEAGGNYLGTVCNFSESFIKSDTSSMKVKYTITNV